MGNKSKNKNSLFSRVIAFICVKYYNFCKRVGLILAPKYFNTKGKSHIIGIPFLLGISYCMIKWIIPFFFYLSYDSVAFNYFDKDDTLFFSSASDVTQEKGKYKVFACRDFPCKSQDSIEFRIRDSSYMDLKWFFTEGQPYNPDELAGVFLSEQNKCDINYYGKRIKYLGFYPKIISASCEPV